MNQPLFPSLPRVGVVWSLCLTLVSLLAFAPTVNAKRVVCVDGCNSAFVNNHEGYERSIGSIPPDVITVGGNLTDCLAMVADGDELVIVAHGFGRGQGFIWNGMRYTDFGTGAGLMPVPAGFNMLSNVSVRFCSCWSARDPDGTNTNTALTNKIVGAMGGGGRGHTAGGYTDLSFASLCYRVTGGTPAERAAALACLKADGSWMNNPPANRTPAATPNQQTAAQAVVDNCAGAGGAGNLVVTIIGYKQPVNTVEAPAGGGIVGCECEEMAPYCGIASGEGIGAPTPTITVTTANNESTPGDGLTSLLEALRAVQDGDVIGFNLAGPGPHVIQTPLGGYPLLSNHNLTIDGYSQPGSVPNSNPILGGNNARLQIYLDSTQADLAPNPGNPALPLRRSTRLDLPDFVGNTGYGTSENGMLAFFGADNATVLGLGFLARHTEGSDADPSIYGVALVREATNARVQGCWFGLAPGSTGQSGLRPAASAVAAFRWRIGGDIYSYGAKIGTDGDGVNDRAEFNVMLGAHITLALELPGAKVSGNYINVFPNGLSFVDLDALYNALQPTLGIDTFENFENGRVTDDTVIGTDGDGVADADERNVMSHAVYDHALEIYSSAQRAVIAGNYFGVGIDGVTPAPVPTNASPDFLDLPGGGSSVRIGSNGDGVSDALEENLIVNIPGARCVKAGQSVPIAMRRNRMVNNRFSAVPFGPLENGSYPVYYGPVLADVSLGVTPVILGFSNNVLHGTFPAPNPSFPGHLIDVCLVDEAALSNETFLPALVVHPRTTLASFQDNGPGDQNPANHAFALNLAPLNLPPSAYVAVTVSFSQDPGTFNAGRAVTLPMSNPAAQRPRLRLRLIGDQTELMWIAPQDTFVLQLSEILDPLGWFEFFGETHQNGRNVLVFPFDPSTPSRFHRLISR